MKVVTLVLILAAATLAFWFVVHQISGAWLDVMLRPEVRDAVERSLADQKRLGTLDPANREQYRLRFEETRRLLNRLDVISMNREALLRRFEIVMVSAFAVALVTATFLWTLRQRRVAARRRQEFVERLASWQEASRRHAHEIKTPLTAAKLELGRIAASSAPGEVKRAIESVYEELERITRFTREFSSFAALSQPILRAEPLDRLLEEFCAMFANAWPNLTLRFTASARPVVVQADRDMLRQVLANLCTNSSRATVGEGTVTFTIAQEGGRVSVDVTDTGSGVPSSIRSRIFEPYVTTSKVGHGMGLGLAISRKILLDHGGDLVLLASSEGGSTFRLTLVAG